MANDGRAGDREDQTRAASWVLVAGGFHSNGGMDRLNLALARHLLSLGSRVNLVCHHAETALRADGAVVHIVPRPAQSFMLGEMLLARRARKIARQVIAGFPGTRVLVNGGNCNWPDINWVHCVHHTWQSRDGKSSPLWFRVKRRYARMRARRQERAALSQAAIVIANSARTRHDLIAHLQIQPDRIHVAYPGSDSNFVPAPPQTRTEARAWLHKEQGRPLIAFIGAMGFDCNKGFDTLFETWRILCARPGWDGDLVAAGAGRTVELWRRKIGEAGLGKRITLLGFTNRVPELLAAADLLVSPVRYEAYGLNVHEAICCAVPAMVTRTAGVAERYPAELEPLLIDDPENPDALAAKLLRWRMAIEYWREKVVPFSQALRSFSLDDMAKQMVMICTGNSRIDDPAAVSRSG